MAEPSRDALVDGIGSFLVAKRVGVPHGELAAAFVQARRLLAQPVEVLVEAEFAGGGNHARLGVEQHRLLIGC